MLLISETHQNYGSFENIVYSADIGTVLLVDSYVSLDNDDYNYYIDKQSAKEYTVNKDINQSELDLYDNDGDNTINLYNCFQGCIYVDEDSLKEGFVHSYFIEMYEIDENNNGKQNIKLCTVDGNDLELPYRVLNDSIVVENQTNGILTKENNECYYMEFTDKKGRIWKLRVSDAIIKGIKNLDLKPLNPEGQTAINGLMGLTPSNEYQID